ncbi:chaperone modulator CbpM [Tatumella sp. JGM118]|uniref:Chaperone modulator CbpM n=1 Tax=Tatumella terrea TaxID=419007 RepID=A0ABW1W1W4_9GAMM|nr:chaperone modulator CbpM [Tatumella sp. JGM118]MBS0908124.1 chaperone modulator CbpM [Tatumella sp. JGM118]
MSHVTITFTVTEFCLHTGLSRPELTEIIGLGVLEPQGDVSEQWLFDDESLALCLRAQRLRRELELDWPGIAVTLSLLDEIERLNSENRQLHQRLQRFTSR